MAALTDLPGSVGARSWTGIDFGTGDHSWHPVRRRLCGRLRRARVHFSSQPATRPAILSPILPARCAN